MIVNYNENGYEMFRERIPVNEWYVELQKATGVTPMTFSLPVTGVV